MQSLVNQAKIATTEDGKGVYGIEMEESSMKKLNHGNKDDDFVNEKTHLGFVKVNMDGLRIGRKMDLNAHSYYNSLSRTCSSTQPEVHFHLYVFLSLFLGSHAFVHVK